MPMAPGQQPAQQQQPQQPQNIGKATDLLVSINDDLNALGDLIISSGLPDSDKQQFSNLLQNFQSFADNLGQPADGGPQPMPQARGGVGVTTPEAGARMPVKPAL